MADALYRFSDEEGSSVQTSTIICDPWKVMIVDDEPSVHELTRTVLKGFSFENRGIEFLSAFSAAQARQLFLEHDDIALVLLDVVMESDNAGLRLVKTIREELHNTATRIILRTGQPGKAVERSVILEYDINDYKEKTELTFQKLFTSVVASLRSYRDIQIIESHRRKLEVILRSSPGLFRPHNIDNFARIILEQLMLILNIDSRDRDVLGYAVSRSAELYTIVSSDGSFQVVGDLRSYEFSTAITERIGRCFDEADHCYGDGFLSSYYRSGNGTENVVYLEFPGLITDFDHHLIDIFLGNVSVAFDNLCLSREIEDTQKEIIYTIGEMIERRSMETSYHVKRVSEVSRVLALKLGLSESESRVIAMAAPMHDIGKLGIPDAILHKAGSLDEIEMSLMQTHTATGYEILNKSNRPILKAAAEIAYSHHEKWDGGGYPQRLKGKDISLYARIVAVADVFDSLLSRRSYKESWAADQVKDFFIQERGRHFDPVITDLLLQNLDEFMAFRNTLGE